ncbi:FAD-dependent oxidoreductase [Allosalinactinospora lopnorensis]|uniref:FAD-dependent oxidoreductase n=1 Tax=Allosalinactinospora lopnorensis TaxID=1352348 RepID=UPI0006981E04|nr:FAD-dependent oxidoreductase [Allosalinactinospora lopnorensis]
MDSTLGTLPPAPVAIVGGGPVGLSLALGLARQGMRSILLERKAATSDRSKAPAIHLRSREIFRQWDTEQPLLDAGVLVRSLPLYRAATGRRPLLSFEFSELETEADRPGILFLEQGRTERVLLEAVRETGLCDLRFDSEVVRLVPGDGGVRLTVREEGAQRVLDAEFAVGCDGGGSFVRKALGLPFEGVTLPVRATLADIHVTDGRDSLPWPRTSNDRSTITSTQRLAPRHWRIVRLEADDPRQDGDVSEEEVHRSAAESWERGQRRCCGRAGSGSSGARVRASVSAACCSPETPRTSSRRPWARA